VANTISNIVPQLLVGGLPTLREMAVTPRLINKSIGNEARDRGDTIDVPVASAIAQRSVTPAAAQAANQDFSPTKVQIALDQWKEASFQLSDKDVDQVMSGTIPMQAAEAVKALANGVDSYVLGLYTGVYNYGGTAGTTPFGTNLNQFKDARKWLNKSLAPMDDRAVVLDSDAEANALVLDQFLRADARGDQGGIIRGQIGEKLGSRWFLNQNVPTHTKGTFVVTGTGAKDYIVNKASVAAGAAVMIFQGATTSCTLGGSLVVGDIFSVGSAAQTYTVTAAASVAVGAGATLSVQFSPVAAAAFAADATVVIVATHQVNITFHRDAFALASRPLSESQIGGIGSNFRGVTDPITGLAMRLELSRQYKQTTYSYDMLYGAKLVRADQAARILG
jgi:hypothetical protein